MAFKGEATYTARLAENLKTVTHNEVTFGPVDTWGHRELTIGIDGPMWVKVGEGSIHLLTRPAKALPVRKRRSPEGVKLLYQFLELFRSEWRRTQATRTPPLTVAGILEEIKRRIQGIHDSADDDVWGERPDWRIASAKVDALRELQSHIEYRLVSERSKPIQG